MSNEIIHQVDFFPTLAAAVGAPEIVPTDRPIDGVNQLPFLEGKQSHSNRTSALFMRQGGGLLAVKWRDWKFWYDYRPLPGSPAQSPTIRLFNLRSDPKEETDILDFNPWVISVMDSIVADYTASIEAYPNVPPAAVDPYIPPWRNR